MNEMLTAGVEIMLIGMGIVYGFLTMLIVAINGMSAIIRRHFPDMPPAALHPAGSKAQDPGTAAAIAAAIHHYKKKHSSTQL